MPLQLSDFRPLEPEELTAQWSDGDLEEDEESWDEDLDEDWDDLDEDLDEDLEGDGWDEDLDEGEELQVDLEAGDDW